MWDLQYGKNSYGLCNGDAAVNGTGATLRGIFGQRRASPPTTPIQIAQIRDGLSNTIMTGEIASFSEHNRIQGSIKTNLTINNTTPPTNCLAFVAGDTYNPPTGDQGWRGGGWCLGAMAHSGFNTVLPPNGPSCNNWRTTDDGFYSAQSYHPGGVTVGLADGSVRFINETVDTGNLSLTHPGTGPSPYGVWGTLGSRAGGESLSLPD
jgi:prepilin-type processing-associated H-X9-DG protein